MYNQDNKFDIDLAKAEVREHTLGALLAGSTVELKTDYLALETGNVAVEFRCRGKASGISVSIADYHVFELHDGDRTLSYIVVATDELKHIARKFYELGRTAKGGDDRLSEMVLVPVEALVMGGHVRGLQI